MNYGQLQTYFLQTLNRRDIGSNPSTAGLAGQLIQAAIADLQRNISVPASERTLVATTAVVTGQLPIPADFLKLIGISYCGRVLEQREPSIVCPLSQHQGIPRYFARVQDVWYIGHAVAAGETICVNYQADFSQLQLPTDENWLTDVAWQAIIDGAMVRACRFYNDPRIQLYQEAFAQDIADINAQASADDLNNAVISPSIHFHDGESDFWGWRFGPY